VREGGQRAWDRWEGVVDEKEVPTSRRGKSAVKKEHENTHKKTDDENEENDH